MKWIILTLALIIPILFLFWLFKKVSRGSSSNTHRWYHGKGKTFFTWTCVTIALGSMIVAYYFPDHKGWCFGTCFACFVALWVAEVISDKAFAITASIMVIQLAVYLWQAKKAVKIDRENLFVARHTNRASYHEVAMTRDLVASGRLPKTSPGRIPWEARLIILKDGDVLEAWSETKVEIISVTEKGEISFVIPRWYDQKVFVTITQRLTDPFPKGEWVWKDISDEKTLAKGAISLGSEIPGPDDLVALDGEIVNLPKSKYATDTTVNAHFRLIPIPFGEFLKNSAP